MAKKVRRKRPRINIHSCSTLFERLAYPRIERDPLWARFSLSLSLSSCSLLLFHLFWPDPELEIRNASSRHFISFSSSPSSLPPPSPSSSLLLRFLFARRPSLSPNARSTPPPPRSPLARSAVSPGQYGPRGSGPVSNGYSKKLFQIEG